MATCRPPFARVGFIRPCEVTVHQQFFEHSIWAKPNLIMAANHARHTSLSFMNVLKGPQYKIVSTLLTVTLQ